MKCELGPFDKVDIALNGKGDALVVRGLYCNQVVARYNTDALNKIIVAQNWTHDLNFVVAKICGQPSAGVVVEVPPVPKVEPNVWERVERAKHYMDLRAFGIIFGENKVSEKETVQRLTSEGAQEILDRVEVRSVEVGSGKGNYYVPVVTREKFCQCKSFKASCISAGYCAFCGLPNAERVELLASAKGEQQEGSPALVASVPANPENESCTVPQPRSPEDVLPKEY